MSGRVTSAHMAEESRLDGRAAVKATGRQKATPMKIQTAVTSGLFLTASALSFASTAMSAGDGDKSAAPALLFGALGLIAAGFIMALVFRSWNNRSRPDLGTAEPAGSLRP